MIHASATHMAAGIALPGCPNQEEHHKNKDRSCLQTAFCWNGWTTGDRQYSSLTPFSHETLISDAAVAMTAAQPCCNEE